MSESETKTQKTILDAAKKVFLAKGFDGARMQEIADEAGINKALLHYYFRSKDRLFDAIFDEAFMTFMPNIAAMMQSDIPFEEKVRGFVRSYIEMLQNNPHLPVFVMREMERAPEKIVALLRTSGINPVLNQQLFMKEVEAGRMISIPFQHLIVNIIGMCIFPFIGRPILEGFIFGGNREAYTQFLEERKTQVADFVIRSLSIH